jgi:hypothetical protein
MPSDISKIMLFLNKMWALLGKRAFPFWEYFNFGAYKILIKFLLRAIIKGKRCTIGKT